jgi:putative Holliday junction resolvase
MAIRNPMELKQNLEPGQRLLGLDLGSKTVGLAISDRSLMIASPLQTLTRTKFSDDAERLQRIIAERAVGGLVIGLPVSMDGREGPRCQSVRQFARNLLDVIDIDVAGHVAQAPRRGDRQDGRRLHPAGRARPPEPERGR